MKTMQTLRILPCAAGCLLLSAAAQEAPSGLLHQTLLPASRLVDRCELCGRPDIPLPLRGRFQVRLQEANPVQAVYVWEAIEWTAGGAELPAYRLQGRGLYRVSGGVALRQEVLLELTLESDQGKQTVWFTNVLAAVERRWPMLCVLLLQTNGTLVRTFELLVEAAPVRDLWFSTAQNFTPGHGTGPHESRSEGDLVSWGGQLVRANRELVWRLGMMPPTPDLGLDAVEVLPGGELVFSVRSGVWSERLGRWAREGDLLSDRGRVILPVEELLSAFEPLEPLDNVGVDALVMRPDGEVWFSLTRQVTSQKLRRALHRGDLLSSTGRVVRAYTELLALFQPAEPALDPGLDAVYIWPNGEIWFSVEDPFVDKQGNRYGTGDLLSDQGWVVARNRDLLAAFQPVEDLADFGLDALQVISDVEPAWPTVTLLPRLVLSRGPDANDLRLDWAGQARFYQLERATDLQGPWHPWGPARLEPPVVETNALLRESRAFYRLRQW
jgi:hypothetical protein